jgi:hypothetical protein
MSEASDLNERYLDQRDVVEEARERWHSTRSKEDHDAYWQEKDKLDAIEREGFVDDDIELGQHLDGERADREWADRGIGD